ncbi:redoxin domain-containing protein [Candidatus Poribacteria bacterium]|nr:redoxin domain-containing protein [Candidatus Poribacteria bacterium]MBT5532658.1 redoxin domain-containing protein [Candidatus Poribacteria bacterium]MBT5709524.1 redoxin domain-containing protein [Candidatus Poribacteria bacterium]MBT7100249.1 redoxin domain-containing protein [Candidatus Poribacteria bacterium]MBT7803925.1 redoxin domain-containing protein [Candidatus Poribacteria bacterium]
MTAAVAALVVLGACSGSKTEEKPQAAAEVPEAPAPAVGPEVGNRAPAFSLPNGRGEAVALADYAGKPVAVVFYRGQW